MTIEGVIATVLITLFVCGIVYGFIRLLDNPYHKDEQDTIARSKGANIRE